MITNLKKFVESLKDESSKEEKPKYEYGCVMLQLTGNEEWWENILSLIADEDLYVDEENPGRYGKEHEPHVTIKYGLHDWEFQISELKKEIEGWGEIEGTLQDITLFENELFDVVKFDVISDRLCELNKEVSDGYPCTDSFPNYHPHCTIAYVKKGMGSKYVKKLQEPYPFSSNIVKLSGSGDEDRQELLIDTAPKVTKIGQ